MCSGNRRVVGHGFASQRRWHARQRLRGFIAGCLDCLVKLEGACPKRDKRKDTNEDQNEVPTVPMLRGPDKCNGAGETQEVKGKRLPLKHGAELPDRSKALEEGAKHIQKQRCPAKACNQ